MNISRKKIVCFGVILCIFSLDHRFKVLATDLKSEDLIFSAAEYGDGPEILRLIKSGVSINSINELGFSPLYLAVYNDQPFVVDLMLRNRADVNLKIKTGFSPLFLAASKGNWRIVDILIWHNADVNIKNNDDSAPIHIAAKEGYLRITDSLIRKGADVNSKMNKEWTPIFFAASNGHDKIVDILIRSGADVNFKKSDGRDALFFAVQEGHIHIVDQLIKNGANVNSATTQGWTPLFLAAETDDHLEIATLLIEKGADVNHTGDGGVTALHISAQNGQYQVMKLLIMRGANFNAKLSNIGWMPIHSAAANDQDGVIGLLFRSGVNLDDKTSDGRTALFIASEYGKEKVAEELFSLGANQHIKDNNGKSSIDIAMEKGFSKIVALLHIISRPAVKACQEYLKLSTNRILGGENAELGEFPWMAALGYRTVDKIEFNCGGTLISDSFVMTAAHCVRQKRAPVLIRVGKLKLNDASNMFIDYGIQEIIRHTNFSYATLKNDIALIRTNKSVIFTDDILPGCLHLNLVEVFTNGNLIVTGWGTVAGIGIRRADALQKAQLTSMPLSECNEILLNINKESNDKRLSSGLISSQYCALDPNGRNDSCQGDSGGPLQFISHNSSVASTIVGIVSFGIGCATGLPGVYTRVASYIDWIESIVWPVLERDVID